MACSRGCSSVSICEGSICCIQFQNDCGLECSGLPSGFSRIQLNALGQLEICTNIGGECTCEVVGSGTLGTDTLVDNGDGTYTHTAMDGTIVIINVGDITGTDTLVDNGDGTYTHTSVDGTIVIVGICSSLQYCDLSGMGNVTGGATTNQYLIFNGTDWVPTDPPAEHTSVEAHALSAGITWSGIGNIPTDLLTEDQVPTQASITNPSADRSMAVQIVWQGYGSDISLQSSTADLFFSYAIQPHFYLGGALQGNPFTQDAIATINGTGLTSFEQNGPTNSWTTTVILAPGATLIASMDATLRASIPHNADIDARISIDPGTISMIGTTI